MGELFLIPLIIAFSFATCVLWGIIITDFLKVWRGDPVG